MRRTESGSALLIAIFALAILGMLGIALLSQSQHGRRFGRADGDGKRAFYIAEAGLQHARLALFSATGNGSFDAPLLAASGGAGGNTTIDFDPDGLVPRYDASGMLTGFSAGVGDDVPYLGLTSFDDGVYTAFLSNDAVDGTASTNDSNGRVLMTAVGASRGGSLEVVQAILETDALWSMPPPAALTLIGPTPTYRPGPSNAKIYSGTDCMGAGKPGFVAPAVGAIGADATEHVEANMGKPTYEAGGLPPEDAIADLTDPTEPAVTAPIASEWTDCFELRDMIERIRAQADVVCTTPGCVLPPPSPDRIVFADTNFVIRNGEGLLVVTGRATMQGSVNWTGPILVVGEGILNRAGGGNGVLSGSMVVADIAGPDEKYGTDDDCGGPACEGVGDDGTCGFQPSEFRTNGGGNSTISYCSTALDASTPLQLYKITDFLQR